MVSIKQLSDISIEVIYEAFVNAFADYVEPFNLTFQQLKYMIERRGCNLNLSFGAFDGDELVGFTLNGIGNWNGSLTAYDTGTGIIKEFREKGSATALVRHLIEFSEGDEIKIINADATYEPFKKFAESINLPPGFGQYEMKLDL